MIICLIFQGIQTYIVNDFFYYGQRFILILMLFILVAKLIKKQFQ